MNYDKFGQAHTTTQELCDLLYQNPKLDLTRFLVTDAEQYNKSVSVTYSDLPHIQQYQMPIDILYNDTVEAFDYEQQTHWYMPSEYSVLDIASWLLDQCDTDAKLQRVAQELLLYQERDMFPLLRYLKYFVDTMRKNSVVWGVGRGSSVASYVLYLIGVHRIDSMYYDLDITEFLK